LTPSPGLAEALMRKRERYATHMRLRQ
jgi:hypothetical protein